jgi:hypothetical protein
MNDYFPLYPSWNCSNNLGIGDGVHVLSQSDSWRGTKLHLDRLNTFIESKVASGQVGCVFLDFERPVGPLISIRPFILTVVVVVPFIQVVLFYIILEPWTPL